jgi:hypothetical protein
MEPCAGGCTFMRSQWSNGSGGVVRWITGTGPR